MTSAPLPDVFPSISLEDVASLKGGYAFKSSDYVDDGAFVLRTLNVGVDGSIRRDNAVFIDEERVAEFERFKLVEWDTVFVMVGATLGKTGLVRPHDLPALLNQNMWVIRAKPEIMDPRFLHYMFTFQSKTLLAWASGAARDFVKRDDFRKLMMPTPSLSEQCAISELLGVLDDKIDSNQRKIVKAKELMHLEFLASTVSDSREGSLGEVLTESRKKVFGDSAAVVVLSALAEGQLVVSDDHFKKKVYSKEIDKYLKVPQWAFAYNPSRINIGSIGLNSSTTVGAVSPVYVVAQAKTSSIARWVEQALRTRNVKDQIVAYSSGSVRQVLRYADFASIQLNLPSDEALSGFEDRTRTLYSLADVAAKEVNSLSILRDTLIPELLSGRLRVKHAESMMENV